MQFLPLCCFCRPIGHLAIMVMMIMMIIVVVTDKLTIRLTIILTSLLMEINIMVTDANRPNDRKWDNDDIISHNWGKMLIMVRRPMVINAGAVNVTMGCSCNG